MASTFIRTNSEVWGNKTEEQKNLYNDSIVFIEDNKLIWSNNIYYNGNDDLIYITYSELKTLRDNNQLIPGMLYRITDYEATTTQEGTMALNEQLFDIIVTADDINIINPNARAAIGTKYGSIFELYQRYEDWELKYDIDNGSGFFKDGVGIVRCWGDTSSGKGLIYYLKDEYGNTCGFDFKNIVINVSYAQGESVASNTLNEAVDLYDVKIANASNMEEYLHIFAGIVGVYDTSIIPLYIRNAKISNYIHYKERPANAVCCEYIPYVIIFPYEEASACLNINIENSNKIFITHEISGDYDGIIREGLLEFNINIKNSVDIILCDVYSKNVNIINSGYNDGVCIMGEIYDGNYIFGGFQGRQLLLNNVGTCFMEMGLEFFDYKYRSKLIIKINNCETCILRNCEPTNNFICDNAHVIYLNNITNNHLNIIIKNISTNPPSIIPGDCGMVSNDYDEFEYIFTNEEFGKLLYCNTKGFFNIISNN